MKYSTIDDMKIIEELYDASIIKKIGGMEVILEKVNVLEENFKDFLLSSNLEQSIYLNQTLLINTVMDYFVDTLRIKEFHRIERTNVYKRIAYMVYWIMKRKPIQILPKSNDVPFNINEKFATMYLVNEMLVNYSDTMKKENWEKSWAEIPQTRKNNFFRNWEYFLTYRNFNAQNLEIALMNFEMGINIGENIKPI